jgi:hypothetical protein
MSSSADLEDQECKCYKVLSTKPLSEKGQVFDILASFLRKDKDRQSSTQPIEDDDGDDQNDSNLWGRDLVREKASWNELRRWANELLSTEDGSDNDRNTNKKRPRRAPIEAWTRDKRARTPSGEDTTLGGSDVMQRDVDSDEDKKDRIKIKEEENMQEESRITTNGMIKAETMESTGRAEVAIAGRSAGQSFEDHVQSDLDDIEEARKQMESKEAKKARKKEKKEAKKAKKEAKKKAKKEKKEPKK